jgi:YD repeat-containing protein
MITTYTYDRANRLQFADAGGAVTTYTNDLAGHRTAELRPSSDSTYYAWDAAGRMGAVEVMAGSVTLVYDADGRRVAKQGTDGSAVGYLFDVKRLLHETDEVGGEVNRTYASGTQDEFGDLVGEDGEFSHAYDAQANTDALLDDGGAVEARYKYRAFGQVAAVSVDGDAWAQLSADDWAALTADGWATMRVDWSALPPELTTHMLAGGRKGYYRDP